MEGSICVALTRNIACSTVVMSGVIKSLLILLSLVRYCSPETPFDCCRFLSSVHCRQLKP